MVVGTDPLVRCSWTKEGSVTSEKWPVLGLAPLDPNKSEQKRKARHGTHVVECDRFSCAYERWSVQFCVAHRLLKSTMKTIRVSFQAGMP